MSFAAGGLNPLVSSALPQLLGLANAITPELMNPSQAYAQPYGGGGYGMPMGAAPMPSAGYGAGYATLPYAMPTGYESGYTGMPGAYTVMQTTTIYQQVYYGGSPVDPYNTGYGAGLNGTISMPTQSGWGGGYYPYY